MGKEFKVMRKKHSRRAGGPAVGQVIAVLHRFDDVEEKWVVAPEGMRFSAEEILATVAFQEQYFQIQLRMEKTT